MANPFEVAVPNPLQALMAFDQSYKSQRDMQQQQRKQDALRSLLMPASNGAAPDYNRAALTLLSSGDPQSAAVLMNMGKVDKTDETKEYELAKSQGFKGSFFDFKTALKRAGATNVNTNVTTKMEGEYDKAMGKEFAEQNVGMIKGAATARGKIAGLERLGALLDDPNTYTGAGGELVADAKRVAKAIGIDVGDVSGAEAARAISNQLALELRNPAGGAGMPGALSDKDREFLQASIPGLTKGKGGNRQIVDYMKRVANRSIEVDRLRQDYVRRKGRIDEGFYRELADYSEKNPLFPEGARAPAATGPAAGAGKVIIQNGWRYKPDGTPIGPVQ
jgi:hypothetical protein